MNIIQRFIPSNLKDTRPGIKMNPKYITIHETDNPSKGANADAHARLQVNGNNRQASWHLQVDDTQSIQSIPFDEIAWAAGDGANGTGNTQSIHLEICVNSEGDYKKAVANAAEVTKQLMQQFNIPIANVVQHNKWSGKNCPSIMRSGTTGITWDIFIGMLNQTKNGWVKQTGVWYYYKAGVLVKNDWVKHTDGKWYYLQDNGSMAVSKWIPWKNKWCYVNENGESVTGRKNINGKDYFFQNDGYLIITDKDGVIQ